jgi:hypothetical protein
MQLYVKRFARCCVLATGLVGSAGACATTMAEVPTFDHNVLVVRGYGTKAMVAQKCLTADTIKQLITTDIPESAKNPSCYWVALISSDSSDISRAVTGFIRAKDEFDDNVAGLAGALEAE